MIVSVTERFKIFFPPKGAQLRTIFHWLSGKFPEQKCHFPLSQSDCNKFAANIFWKISYHYIYILTDDWDGQSQDQDTQHGAHCSKHLSPWRLWGHVTIANGCYGDGSPPYGFGNGAEFDVCLVLMEYEIEIKGRKKMGSWSNGGKRGI